MKVLGYAKDQPPGATSLYLPEFIANDIIDVDFAYLKKMGITHILLDLDQTLRRAYSSKLETEVIEIFHKLQTSKMFKDIAIVSNNSSRQLAKYADPIGARLFQPFWHRGLPVRKPNPLFFTRVINELNIRPDQAIMIGDKVRADIIGAHRAGIRTILIKPRGPDYWYDLILFYRLREKYYYRKALRAQQALLKNQQQS